VLVALLVLTSGAVRARARIGETQDALEARLLQPGVGKLLFQGVTRDKDKQKEREAEQARIKEEKEQPFREARPYMPIDIREVVYWKSALGNHLSNDDGWKVHVFYVNGRSVLEAYKRVGAGLSDFEINGILAVNRGESSWRKASGEGDAVSGVGYDFESEDRGARAKVKASWVVVFSARFDAYLVEQKRLAGEQQARELEVKKREQALKAPESLSGF
jgi:hypothetical protein